MKSAIALCILATLCACQTSSAKSVDVDVQPELNVTMKNLKTVVRKIDEVKNFFFIDAYLDLNQRLVEPLMQSFDVLSPLQTQVEIFARQGKDIQSCTHVLKENGDEYKVQYINATADCAANVEIVLSREGKNLGKLYAAGANLLKELKRTNCTESTDVQLCKSTAATKLTDIKARFKSMRKQANHNHIHAISALKSCLENPVKTLDRQVQELQTSTANCLRNL